MKPLPITASLEQYETQASELLRGHAQADAKALRLVHENHPRFLDPVVRWLPLRMPEAEISEALLDIGDARLALARWYSFRDWNALTDLVNAMDARTPGVYEFELAAEAVITGDEEALATILQARPELVKARSSRETCHDPSVHGATLLHYITANGVEGYRQRTPANAVAIARMLLDGGADPDALAGAYGGESTPMSMLVSSSPPAEAGVQIALIETLLEYGADPNGKGTGNWVSPVMTALVFGFTDAAETLARHGARIDSLAIAAGLGRRIEAQALLPVAEPLERHRALALAAHLGRLEIVNMLLDAGEDPNRYNPDGMHAHATPLHHASLAGHESVVRLLVERGARLDLTDKLWKSTPRGWAEHAGRQKLAEYLHNSERQR